MNYAGCPDPSLWGNDEFLLPLQPSSSDRCSTSVVGFATALSVLIAIRVWFTLIVWIRWLSRFKLCGARKPIYPLVLTTGDLVYAFVLISAALSWTNATNGGTTFVITLCFALHVVLDLLHLRHIIRLGRRIVRGGEDIAIRNEASYANADLFLRIVVNLLQLSVLAFAALALAMLARVPGPLINAVFGLSACCVVLVIIGQCYQLERILRAITRVLLSKVTSSKGAALAPYSWRPFTGDSVSPQALAIAKQVSSLRAQQMISVFVAFPCAAFFALSAAEVIPLGVPVYLATIAMEVFFMGFGVYYLAQPAKKRAALHADGTFQANSSALMSGVLVKRGGALAFESMVLSVLQEEVRGGEVVFDDGEDVSVLTQLGVDVDESDVILRPVLGQRFTSGVAAFHEKVRRAGI
jgi:hypothetical protein